MALRGVKLPSSTISMNDIHNEFTTDTTNQNFNFLRVNGLNRVWSVSGAGDNTPTTLGSTNINFSSFRSKMRTPALWITTNSYTLKKTSLIYNGSGAVTYPEEGDGSLPPGWASGDFIYGFNSYGYDTANPLTDTISSLGSIISEDSFSSSSGLITNFDGSYSCGLRSWIVNFSKSPNQILVRFARVGAHPGSAFNTYGLQWNGVDGSKSFVYKSIFASATLLGSYTETVNSDYTRVWLYETSASWLSPSTSFRYAAGISINLN